MQYIVYILYTYNIHTLGIYTYVRGEELQAEGTPVQDVAALHYRGDYAHEGGRKGEVFWEGHVEKNVAYVVGPHPFSQVTVLVHGVEFYLKCKEMLVYWIYAITILIRAQRSEF